MQPANNSTPAGTDPASLIPAAHLPQAAAVAAQNAKNNPNMLEMLQQMQRQINSLMGVHEEQNLADVVLVNPGGRLVEVSGKQAIEYLGKPGFRKATPDEEANYRKAIIRQTPQYLRKLEKKRLFEEKRLLDEIEAEDASDNVSIESLLRAPVTDAQRTGAPEPNDVAKALAQSTPPTNDTTGDSAPAQTSNNDGSPKPPSRRARSTSNKADSAQAQTTSQSATTNDASASDGKTA